MPRKRRSPIKPTESGSEPPGSSQPPAGDARPRPPKRPGGSGNRPRRGSRPARPEAGDRQQAPGPGSQPGGSQPSSSERADRPENKNRGVNQRGGRRGRRSNPGTPPAVENAPVTGTNQPSSPARAGEDTRRPRKARPAGAAGAPVAGEAGGRNSSRPSGRPNQPATGARAKGGGKQAGTPQNRRRGRRSALLDTPLRPPPSVPIPTNRGIKARSQRGTFSQNWWARQWIEAMERLVDPARLQRGRSYARQGQVLSLQETVIGVEARVQGSRPQPYKVTMQVTPLTDEQWDQVITAMSEQALFTAQLLAGEMPANIEDAFHAAGVSLFPDQAGDLYTDCSCPDWANPCKHVAATHYILGDRFDDDPFLLFRMRGRTQAEILQALRERRNSEAVDDEYAPDAQTGEAAPPLEDFLERFWEPVESLDAFPLTIRPPTVDMPLLKRLGDPAFMGGESLQAILKPVYDMLMRSALLAAYSDEEPTESNNGSDYA